jgi:hypothetical protein
MTKRKQLGDPPFSRLQRRLFELRQMSVNLAVTKLKPDRRDGIVLSEDQRRFLVGALSRIGDGENALEVLGIKAERGERRRVKEAGKSDRKLFAVSWVAAAIRPEKDGAPGISLDDAFVKAGEFFRLEEETVRTYWHDHPELRSPSFDRPITSLPDKGRPRG